MAERQQWKPHQLTDSELNRQIGEHQQLLEEPLSHIQREDAEAELQAFLLERENRHAARQAAIDRAAKSYPEPSMTDF